MVDWGGRGAEVGFRDTIHFNFILNITFIVPRKRTVAKTRIKHSFEEEAIRQRGLPYSPDRHNSFGLVSK